MDKLRKDEKELIRWNGTVWMTQ